MLRQNCPTQETRRSCREHNGLTYEVHFPGRSERCWGFAWARTGLPIRLRRGERLLAVEVWHRYRSACAAGEPFDIAVEYFGQPVHPSTVLALARLARRECNWIEIWVPLRQPLAIAL